MTDPHHLQHQERLQELLFQASSRAPAANPPIIRKWADEGFGSSMHASGVGSLAGAWSLPPHNQRCEASNGVMRRDETRINVDELMMGASLVYLSASDLDNPNSETTKLQFCQGSCCKSSVKYARLCQPNPTTARTQPNRLGGLESLSSGGDSTPDSQASVSRVQDPIGHRRTAISAAAGRLWGDISGGGVDLETLRQGYFSDPAAATFDHQDFTHNRQGQADLYSLPLTNSIW